MILLYDKFLPSSFVNDCYMRWWCGDGGQWTVGQVEVLWCGQFDVFVMTASTTIAACANFLGRVFSHLWRVPVYFSFFFWILDITDGSQINVPFEIIVTCDGFYTWPVIGAGHHWRPFTRQRWRESSLTTNLWRGAESVRGDSLGLSQLARAGIVLHCETEGVYSEVAIFRAYALRLLQHRPS